MLALLFIFATAHADSRSLTMSQAANLRQLSNDVLEVAAHIPVGSTVSIQEDAVPEFLPFRAENGRIKASTNGFYPTVQLISVPSVNAPDFPPERIAKLNSTSGGVYLSSLDVNSAIERSDWIPSLPNNTTPDVVYLKHFRSDGKRLTDPYSRRLSKRFGTQFNRAIDLSTLTPRERAKWVSIHHELQSAADRTIATDRRRLFIGSGDAKRDRELAVQYSETFESTGQIQLFGAWSIAVTGTAPRHGFANAPCAEFMSEIIRQAYARVGFSMADDFQGKNYLIWNHTAAVVNLAQALFESGWIPWDPFEFQPSTGAIAMHALATTPGHTYLVAGHSGRFIVDNGSPYGRDLYRNAGKRDYIDFMYDMGVFFLPPGILPARWP